MRGRVGGRSDSHAQRAMQSDPGPVAPLPAEAMHLAEDRTASPAVCESPIGLPHGLSLRTLKSVSHVICLRVRSERPCSASHGLTDLRVRSASHGLTDLRVRSASHAHRAMQSDPRGHLTDFTAKRIASARCA